MTNAERLMEVLARLKGPVCDDCAAQEAGFSRRQVARMEAESLAMLNRVTRRTAACLVCGREKKVSFLGQVDSPPPTNAEWRAWDLSNASGRFVLLGRQEQGRWVGLVQRAAPPANSPTPGLIQGTYLSAEDFGGLLTQARTWVAERSK